MTASPPRPLWPLSAFIGFTALVYSVIVWMVIPELSAIPNPGILAAAAVADMVILVPLAYAWLVVRRHGAKTRTLLPVLAASVAAAWWLLPAEHRGVLDWLVIALPALEVGILLLAVVAILRAFRRRSHSDAYEQIQAATMEAFGDHLGSRALAYEMAVLRYALGRSAAPDAKGFSVRRGYGALLIGFLIALSLEMVGGHVLISHFWGPTAAWIHFAISGYALLWILGDWRALGARPTRIHEGILHLRTGLRWSADVPISSIRSVYHVRGALPTDAPILDPSVLTNPQFILELAEPATATGPYGIQREIARIAVGVDDPDRFLETLATEMTAS